MREKGIWLRKWKKIRVVFLGTMLKVEVIGSFHQPFREFLWYVFFLISFYSCFMGWWIPTSSDDLIIVSPFIEVEEIFFVVFYLYPKGFSTLYLVSSIGWMFLITILDSCYVVIIFEKVVIIVEWLLLLWRNLLILTG